MRGEYVRQSLDLRSWEAASDLVHDWEATGKIGGTKTDAVTVREAIDRYLADAAARQLADTSLRKFREILIGKLLPFCTRHGFRRLSQLDVDRLRQFRETWTYSPISAQKRLEHVRSFFRFCHQAGWIDSNPALALKPPKVNLVPTLPFSPDEVDRILTACDTAWPRGKWATDNRKRLRAMALLLRYSGLRISDAATLERARVSDTRLFLYTQKTGTPVWLPLPQFVIDAISACPNDNSLYVFWTGRGKRTTAVNVWERAFQRVFELAQVPNAHLHRYRDTFAVSLLERGVSIETLGVLLGHASLRTTERHYKPWVQTLQNHLEVEVRKAWSGSGATV